MTSNAEHLNKIFELNDKHLEASTDLFDAQDKLERAKSRCVIAQNNLWNITAERRAYLESVFSD